MKIKAELDKLTDVRSQRDKVKYSVYWDNLPACRFVIFVSLFIYILTVYEKFIACYVVYLLKF